MDRSVSFPIEGSCLLLDEQLLTFLYQNKKYNEVGISKHNAVGVAWYEDFYWFFKKKTSKECFSIDELLPHITIFKVGDVVVNLEDQVLKITEIDKYIFTCNDGNHYYNTAIILLTKELQNILDEIILVLQQMCLLKDRDNKLTIKYNDLQTKGYSSGI